MNRITLALGVALAALVAAAPVAAGTAAAKATTVTVTMTGIPRPSHEVQERLLQRLRLPCLQSRSLRSIPALKSVRVYSRH